MCTRSWLCRWMSPSVIQSVGTGWLGGQRDAFGAARNARSTSLLVVSSAEAEEEVEEEVEEEEEGGGFKGGFISPVLVRGLPPFEPCSAPFIPCSAPSSPPAARAFLIASSLIMRRL